jgi:hypothetical protein
LKHQQLKEKLKKHKESMEQAVIDKNNKVKEEEF